MFIKRSINLLEVNLFFPQQIKIAEIIIHPDYWSDKTKHGNSYDLALIKMDQVFGAKNVRR